LSDKEGKWIAFVSSVTFSIYFELSPCYLIACGCTLHCEISKLATCIYSFGKRKTI